MQEYDLVVIGSGPGGQKAAIAAAKLGKSVAVIERGLMLGGVCVNTGTIPSKTLREAVVYLTGMSQRELYGASYRVKEKITPADLLARTQHVIGKEIDVVRSQLMRNRVELYVGPRPLRRRAHHPRRRSQPRRAHRPSAARYIVIATGTKPARPAGVEFDEDRVLDSDGILDLKSIPTSMVVVGAGVIGIEYASMFAALGTKVTVVEKRDNMLDFCDPEIIEALKFHLRDLAVTFRFGEEVTAVDVGVRGHGHHAGQRQADPRRDGDVLRRAARVRPTTSTWRTPGWRPTTAAGSSSTTTSRPRSTTSTPSATSSASPRWPRRRWTRAGWPPTTRSASRPTA